jgi:hypothetical protein
MSGLENMLKRASYKGYDRADNRNVTVKYKSFQAALKQSYQAEWITLDKDTDKERKYRCLINASRLTEQFDKKVLSIDFDSGVEEGTVFYWDRTNRYWIIGLQQHTEEAYFRGIITRCDYTIDIDGKSYWVSVRGPVETSTIWNKKHGINWNDLNYSMVIQITKDSKTVEYFTRHQVVKMKLAYPDVNTGEKVEEWHNWKVVATDKYSEDKIIEVYLDEWYDNTAEDNMIVEKAEEPDLMQPHIEGPHIVHVFDENISYSIVGFNSGKFVVNSNKIKIISMTPTSCVVNILASKATKFILTFIADDGTNIDQEIIVQSF